MITRHMASGLVLSAQAVAAGSRAQATTLCGWTGASCSAADGILRQARREPKLVIGGDREDRADERELDEEALLIGVVEVQLPAREQPEQPGAGGEQRHDDRNGPDTEAFDRRQNAIAPACRISDASG